MNEINKNVGFNSSLNTKIIGISGKMGSGKNYIGEKIIGRHLYDLGYNVHILAFADQLKYEIGIRNKILEENKKKNEKTMNEIEIYRIGFIELFKDVVFNKSELLLKDRIDNILIYFEIIIKMMCKITSKNMSNILRYFNIFDINFEIKSKSNFCEKRYFNKLDHYKYYNNITKINIKRCVKNYNLVFNEKPVYVRKMLQMKGEERDNDEYLWINSLHFRMINILEKSYNKENDVFIITDVRYLNEMSFIKSMNGIVVRINLENEENIKNEENSVKKHISEIGLDHIDNAVYDCVIKNTFDKNVNIENVIKLILK